MKWNILKMVAVNLLKLDSVMPYRKRKNICEGGNRSTVKNFQK